jgi:dipeptidyl aminopeptidase/acylaminoacyl peptidase
MEAALISILARFLILSTSSVATSVSAQTIPPAATPAPAASPPIDLATAFGAREGVLQASLSPDGAQIAILTPGKGQGTELYVIDAAAGSSRRILTAPGNPARLSRCDWVGKKRLACEAWGLQNVAGEIVGFSSMLALDDSGANQKPISPRRRFEGLYNDLRGGNIIDLLPDEDGAVLMQRSYVPEFSTGTMLGSTAEGIGVDRVDTRSGVAHKVVPARKDAATYITDGRGVVRIMGQSLKNDSGYSKGRTIYAYRKRGETAWLDLSSVDTVARTGFDPRAVDPDKNVVYGFEKIDGRQALVTYSLDGVLTRTVVLARPDVDVGGLVRIGRRARVVGVTYSNDYTRAEIFDPSIQALKLSLQKALGGDKQVSIVDTSVDEMRALVWAGNDADPGRYYLLDRKTKKLSPVLPERPSLAGMTLSTVKPVRYRGADGTMIPGYLTLPPGSNGKGLPAVVLPHGGPESRDYWGFDWLPQYFAARGFAVLQPQFRGSAGYGEQWFLKNGFQSWRTSIGDVTDAGRWMVADPARLVVFGWSYGGYAALQATVLAPGLFKAAVAVAPVTDLASLTDTSLRSSTYYLERNYIGTGPHLVEGSPAQNVGKITVPVLMFHGTLDANVPIAQARLMHMRLKAAGKSSELVVFDGLDHQLEDSVARATMLRRAGDFLLTAGK